MKRLRSLDFTVWAAIAIASVVAIGFFVWLVKGRDIVVKNRLTGSRIVSSTSPLTGMPCADPTRRPIAVMLASDTEARPLSGLAAADMIFEMPVTPNGITRMMAVYQCNDPEEVGSIRSARFDFIPLVSGLDAIYGHWGGERAALEQLNAGATDNIDALVYEGTVYHRKKGVPRPHNGFTTLGAMRQKADELGYAASSSLTPYAHSTDSPERNLAALITEAGVSWPQGFDVSFRYDTGTNRYLRWRGGSPEVDRISGATVSVAVVIVLQTDSTPAYDQYISVRTTGTGNADIYQNGRHIEATWKKPAAGDMLEFLDETDEPIGLAPGPIWILYDTDL